MEREFNTFYQLLLRWLNYFHYRQKFWAKSRITPMKKRTPVRLRERLPSHPLFTASNEPLTWDSERKSYGTRRDDIHNQRLVSLLRLPWPAATCTNICTRPGGQLRLHWHSTAAQHRAQGTPSSPGGHKRHRSHSHTRRERGACLPSQVPRHDVEPNDGANHVEETASDITMKNISNGLIRKCERQKAFYSFLRLTISSRKLNIF